jgi:phosphoglycolate phosphatase
MYRAVTFDLDGTLIDSTEAIVDSFYFTFDRLGVDRPAREAVVGSIGYTLENQFRQLGVAADRLDACAAVYREAYGAVCLGKTTLLPGVADCLDRLGDAGLPIGLATSKRLDYAELILDHFGLKDRFAARIGPGEVADPKPAPDAFLAAAKGLGVAPADMVVVGDSRFDVAAARAACCPVLALTTGYESRVELESHQPDAVLASLAEAADWVLARVDRVGRECALREAAE